MQKSILLIFFFIASAAPAFAEDLFAAMAIGSVAAIANQPSASADALPPGEYSENGTHRCKQGGSMYISGHNGRYSTPTVTFKGVKYTMRPYTPPGASYDTFVADNQSGIELGVGKWLSLTNGNGSICTSKDWYPWD